MCQPTVAQQQQQQNKEDNDTDTLILSPHRRSVVAQQRVYLEIAIAFLSILYGTLLYVWQPPFVATEKYCSGSTACERRDLVAYKITSCVAFLIMAAMGIYHWYGGSFLSSTSATQQQERLYTLQHSTSTTTQQHHQFQKERLFGTFLAADFHSICIVAYQTWDIAVSLTIPEYQAEPLFFLHHVLAGSTALLSWQLQVFPFAAVFFGGCAEISSIALVICDAKGMLTVLDEYPYAVGVCQGVFVVTFTYFRIVAWWRWSIVLWQDVRVACQHNWWTQYRPGCSSIVYGIFLLLNVLLTALQVYWFGKIMVLLYDLFFGQKGE